MGLCSLSLVKIRTCVLMLKVGFKHPFALKRAGVVGQLLIKHSHFNVHLNIVYWQRCIIKSDKKSWFESSKVFMRGGHPHIIGVVSAGQAESIITRETEQVVFISVFVLCGFK